MSGHRFGASTAFWLVGLIAGVAAAEPPNPAPFTGIVHDSVGNLLDGVEVLVAAASVANSTLAVEPVASAVSDGNGRFLLQGLAPGIYRAAAVKAGYRTWIGQVDTRAERILALVLHPAETIGGGVTPAADPAWALRLPRRTIFRDVDVPWATYPGDGADPEFDAEPASSAPVNVQIDHVQAIAGLGAAAGDAPLEGRETRLRLASMIGERAHVVLGGLRREVGSSSSDTSAAMADHDTAAVSVGLSYAAGDDAQVRVKAFYQAQDLSFGSAAPGPLSTAPEFTLQAWGYESEWTQQISPASSFEVQFDYRDQTLASVTDRIEALSTIRAEAAIARPQTFANRNIDAGGSFQSVPADDHQLEVGFTAQINDGQVAVPPVRRVAMAIPVGAQGWSVRLDAQDTWSVNGPLSLVYGLGYRQALSAQDLSAVQPKVGGIWSAPGLRARATISYLAVARWESSVAPERAIRGAGPGASGAPAESLGYDVEVEVPLGGQLRLFGATRYTPLDGGSANPGGEFEASALLFVSDGLAAVSESRLALVHDSGHTRTAFEWSRGSAEGLLAAWPGEVAAFRLLAPGRVDFTEGRCGVLLAASGTDLQLSYRQITERDAGAALATRPTEREVFELRVGQELVRLRGFGNWKLLMALRLADGDEGPLADDEVAIVASNPADSGVSAGLSVRF